MKNQCFGDINDYRKYGLLRILTGRGEIKTAVCWMLAPVDGRRDGSRIRHLSEPEEWCDFDPELFPHLKAVVQHRGVRDIWEIENSDPLPSCAFLSDSVPDDKERRSAYFERLMDLVVATVCRLGCG